MEAPLGRDDRVRAPGRVELRVEDDAPREPPAHGRADRAGLGRLLALRRGLVAHGRALDLGHIINWLAGLHLHDARPLLLNIILQPVADRDTQLGEVDRELVAVLDRLLAEDDRDDVLEARRREARDHERQLLPRLEGPARRRRRRGGRRRRRRRRRRRLRRRGVAGRRKKCIDLLGGSWVARQGYLP